LAVKLRRTLQFSLGLLSVVPLINVLFLVVIFFAVGTRFVLQPGMAVSLPVSSFTLPPQTSPQIVSITAAPVPAIYHADRKITLEELGPLLNGERTASRSLVIKADRATPYELVVDVMNVGLEHGYSVILATASDAP